MGMTKVMAVKARHKQLNARKQPWLQMFQLVGEYVMTRKQNFTSQHQPGAFLNNELFDNTAQKSLNIMASALLGHLWPNGARSFRLLRPRNIPDTHMVREYYAEVTRRMSSIMDDPKAGLTVALDEYMRDQGAFGTSAIAIFEDEDNEVPLRFKAWDVKTMTIDEGKDGFVDTIYNEREISIRRLVKEYGYENISKQSRDKFDEGSSDDKVRVLHAIEPRLDRDPLSFGSQDMPYSSIHIELGPDKILRESGFEEMPVRAARFFKALGEIYGRSPAMAALPDIVEINVVWEAVTVAIEKQLDPPLGLLNDGALGGGIVDTSPGALNVFNITGKLDSKSPIFPLYTVGELKSSQLLIEVLTKSISDHFFIDRLLDLNNDTRMTLGEAQIRNKLRGDSLGTLFSRQIAELFNPIIERTFNILLKREYLGVMPNDERALLNGLETLVIPEEIAKAMARGEDVFRIQYISPAARIVQSEELQGILLTLSTTAEAAAAVPELADNLDLDFLIKRIAELTGTPEDAIVGSDKIADLRAAREQQQAQQQKLMAADAVASIAQKTSQAAATESKTGAAM